jgi:Family of unknown function (DUF6445)
MVTEVGHSRAKVVCLDAALDDPDAVRLAAFGARFSQDSQFYPGIRAPLPRAIADELVAIANDSMMTMLGQTGEFVINSAQFAIVCQPSHSLKPAQRIPHFDGCDDDLYASILYLTPETTDGTAFYRHVSSGFEAVRADTLTTYFDMLKNDINQYGGPRAAYVDDNTPYFERIASFAGVPNRMLLYPGNILHSGIIDQTAVLHPSPEKGRLTITGFLRLRR